MKFISSLVILLFTLLLSGCQSTNSETAASPSSNTNTNVDNTDNTIDLNGSISLVILNGTTKVLTENSEQVSISIRVLASDNSPYSEGNISVAYPDKVQSGTDVGSFVSSSVSITNGVATFSYTGPKNLQSLVDSGDTSTRFGFYHNTDTASIKYYTLTYSPTPNQIVLTDYFLKESSSADTYTMALQSTRQLSFYIENDKGEKIADADVTTMKVKLLNPALADIKDTTNNVGDELTFTKNNVSVTLQSFTRSGIVPIEVSTTFTDVNGAPKSMTEVFYITILSGPPTAMSISYEGTIHDEVNAKFQENMIITITDKYFNPVNTQPAVAAYMIAGFTLENSANLNSRIYFETTDAKAATMDPTANSLTTTATLTNVDMNNDILLTYAKGYNYNVSGKWDMASINGSSIVLADTIDAAASVTGVAFGIGNNFRQDTCRDDKKWVGFVRLESDRFDTNGIVKAVINYDYYLTGKSIMLGVDLVGYTASSGSTSKFGTSVKHTLRGIGFESMSCSVPAGAVNYTCRLSAEISQTAEWLRNANMGYNITTSDNLSVVGVANSNGNVHDCLNYNGIAYVDVTVTENKGEAGTITIEKILVGSEF